MRNFRVLACEQRSPEWFAARAGRLTGSRAKAMLAKGKAGEAAARRDLRMQLVCERVTGRAQDDGFVNDAMQRGIDCEPLARAVYEARTGNLVQASGFLEHLTVPAGCSLDGHLGDYDGLVSIKCPKSATHLRYLRDGVLPADYVPQMLHELWITGAQCYDFVSWDDRFPPELQVFYLRVPRDEHAVREYATAALAFLREVETECAALATMTNLRGVLEMSL